MPARVELLSDSPVAQDRSEMHKRVTDAIENLILNSEEGGKSIALTGGWGSGKSSVIETLRKRFDEDSSGNTVLFLFDAWAHQDDPLRRAFLEQLREFLLEHKTTRIQAKLAEGEWQDSIDKVTGRKETVTSSTEKHFTDLSATVTSLLVICIPVGALVGLLSKPDYKAFGIVFGIVPLLVAAIALWIKRWREGRRYLSILESKPTKKDPDTVFSLLVRDATETKTTETEKTGEPMAAKFFDVFTTLAKTAVGPDRKRKLVIVVDNLDRLEPAKAVSMWSTMRVFFELGQKSKDADLTKHIWLIAPFDRLALERLWAKESDKGDLKKLVDSFVSKTFQIEFRVPTPVLSKWREFFLSQFKVAFKDSNEQCAADDVFRIYERLHGQRGAGSKVPSLREIKLFVNRMVGLHLQWPQIDLRYITFYLMKSEELAANPLLMAKHDTFEPAIRELLPDGWNAEKRQRLLGAMHFNVEEDVAVHALIGERLETALLNQDGPTINDLSSVNQFWLACETAIANTADALAADGPKLVQTFELLDPILKRDAGESATARRNLCGAVLRSRWQQFNDASAGLVTKALGLLEDEKERQKFRRQVLKDAGKLPGEPQESGYKAIAEVVTVLQADGEFRFEPMGAANLVAVHRMVSRKSYGGVTKWLQCNEPAKLVDAAIDGFSQVNEMDGGLTLMESLREAPLDWGRQVAAFPPARVDGMSGAALLALARGDDAAQGKVLDHLFGQGMERATSRLETSPLLAGIAPMLAMVSRRPSTMVWAIGSRLRSSMSDQSFAATLARFLLSTGLGHLLLTKTAENDRWFLIESLRQFGQSPDCLDAEVFVREFPAMAAVPEVDWRAVATWMNTNGGLAKALSKAGLFSSDRAVLYNVALAGTPEDDLVGAAIRGFAALENAQLTSTAFQEMAPRLLALKGASWVPSAQLAELIRLFPEDEHLQRRAADDARLSGVSHESLEQQLPVLADTSALPLLDATLRRAEGETLLRPTDAEALARRGELMEWKTWRMAGRDAGLAFQEASKWFEAAVAADAGNARGVLGRARMLRRQAGIEKDNAAARELLKQVQSLISGLTDERAELVQARCELDFADRHLHGGEPAEAFARAMQHAQTALAGRPDWAVARVVQARVLRMKAGRTPARDQREELLRRAASDLEQILNELPALHTARVLLSRVLLDLEDADGTAPQRRQRAAELLREAVAARPNDVEALAGLGVVMARQAAQGEAGTVEEAVKQLTAACALDPEAVPPRIYRAQWLWDQGKHAEARQAAEEALALRPDSAWAHATLAEAVLRGAQQSLSTDRPALWTQCEDHLQKALGNRPDYTYAHWVQGRLLQARALYSDAIRSFEEALRYREGDADSLRSMGDCFREQQDFAKAAEWYRQAVEVRPSAWDIRCERARMVTESALRSDVPDFAAADEEFQAALQSHPQEPRILVAWSDSLRHRARRLPDPQACRLEAIEKAQRALDLDGDSPAASTALGRALVDHGRRLQGAPAIQEIESAIQHFTKALVGGEEAWRKLALAEAHTVLAGKVPKDEAAEHSRLARVQIAAVFQTEPGNADALAAQAHAAVAEKDFASAVTIYRTALTQRPNTERIYTPLGHALMNLADRSNEVDAALYYAEAEAAFEKARGAGPNLASSWLNLAQLKLRRGVKWPDEELRRASALEPGNFDVRWAQGRVVAGKWWDGMATPEQVDAAFGDLTGTGIAPADVWVQWGDTYRERAMLDSAKKCYETALTLAKDMEWALLGLARVNAARQRWDEADAFFQRAEAAPPGRDAVPLSWARSLHLQGLAGGGELSFHRSDEEFAKALLVSHRTNVVYREMADALISRAEVEKDNGRAIGYLDRALEALGKVAVRTDQERMDVEGVSAGVRQRRGDLMGGTMEIRKRVNPKDGLTYVWVPPGTFVMGSTDDDGEAQPDEKPAHPVTLTKGFWLSETPVTQAAWRKVMGTNPSRFRGDDRPVEQVSWKDAKEYCNRAGVRLPTEAQWEYAARAGTTTPRYGDLDKVAWQSKSETGPVKQREPNSFGLYDMLGNVWEWVEDRYGRYDPEGKAQVDPTGSPQGDIRVVRGGSFSNVSRYLRSAFRDSGPPGLRDDYLGFRCTWE